MAEMDIDPAVLRQLAEQHLRVAEETRAWAKPPQDWLDAFIPTYGKIASPVYDALIEYYNARQQAGENLADQHVRTAEELRAAADAYEQADHDFANKIRQAGEGHDGAPTGHGGPSTPTPTGIGPAPVGGHAPADGVRPAVPVSSGPAQTGIAPMTPAGPAVPEMPAAASADPAMAPGQSAPMAPAAHAGADSGVTGTTTSTSPGSGVYAGTAAGPVPTGPVPVGPMGSTADSQSAGQPGVPANGTNADAVPVPMAPTPFGAAIAKAREKQAAPSYMVGEEVDGDLVVARTLLQAVLAATEATAIGLHWSVAVLRGPAGAGVFITSNEGRGWLPAGMYLPREVSTPWVWDDMLGDTGGAGSPWEGISDPARILVEFALAWGPKANAELVALVSSAPIDGGLRTRFPNVAMEGFVGPEYEVDLRINTPDTADRLALAGSAEAADSTVEVPEAQIRSRLVQFAADAHGRVARAVASTPDAAESRRIRDRILAVVEAGQPVSRQWWDELREADDLLAAAMLSRRMDVGRVEPGELRVDEEGAALRGLVFERRCNELLFLLAEEESNRQLLRDATYAYDQIMNHPRFEDVSVPVAVGAEEKVTRPVGVPGQVSAPSVTAGPPPGSTVSAPAGPPPVITTDRN